MEVETVTSFGRDGLQDWLLQRISAVIMALYIALLLIIWAIVADSNIATWQQVFSYPFMRGITFLALLALLVHAWIGMWIVSTDYIKNTSLRLMLQIVVVIALFFYLLWGAQILWA